MKDFLKSKLKRFRNRLDSNDDLVTVIEPRSSGKIINFMELKQYRDLFYFLVWRNIKVLYAQTILGFSWAILQPLIQIVVYTIIFGKVAKLSTDGIPYFLYATVAIIPWTYMSQSMSESSQSLVQGQGMLGKIYFPRILFPITPILAKLVDFGFSILILIGVLAFYRITPTWNLLFLPLFFFCMISISASIGILLSAFAIRFRDVRYAMQFALRMLIYSAPIVYSASSIPAKYRIIYSFNPIVTVIEGYRACLIGTPVPWLYIWPGIITIFIMLISSTVYFKRMEHIFVDVI